MRRRSIEYWASPAAAALRRPTITRLALLLALWSEFVTRPEPECWDTPGSRGRHLNACVWGRGPWKAYDQAEAVIVGTYCLIAAVAVGLILGCFRGC